MKRRDLTLGGSGELQITELEKTRSELLKDASDSVNKLQRLMKRYEDQISKPGPASEPFGPYRSEHPMTECIADQKSKKNPPRNPAAVCNYIRQQSQKSDFSIDSAMTDWDSMSKAEQDGWGTLEKAKPKDVDPDILEDMAEGGEKPAVDLSLGSGAPVPTVKAPIKPLIVTPGTKKGVEYHVEEALEEVAEARRELEEQEESTPKKAARVGFVSLVPDDIGSPE